MLVGILVVAMLYQGSPTYSSPTVMAIGAGGARLPSNSDYHLSSQVTLQLIMSQEMPSGSAAASSPSPGVGENVFALSGLWGTDYFFDQLRSRRGRLEMYIEITRRLAGGPVTITELGVASKLNFASTREILDFLGENGIVTLALEDGRAKRYSLTERGYEFVRRCEDALGMLDGERKSTVRFSFQSDRI
jgi:predicted transcriptional regulator